MVANRLKLLTKSNLAALCISLFVANLVLNINPVLASADYSRCTYSSGEYSGDSGCDGNQAAKSSQSVAGTGQNIRQIIILILFLGLGSAGFGLVYILLHKKIKNRSGENL